MDEMVDFLCMEGISLEDPRREDKADYQFGFVFGDCFCYPFFFWSAHVEYCELIAWVHKIQYS